jgi:hypothetical protein
MSPINDLLEGNSNAQPKPERKDNESKCQTSIKLVIIRIKALKEENIKIIVDKFIKILLSNLSAYLPIIQPTINNGATLRPEFKATSKALSLNLKIIYADTNTSKYLQNWLIPPIIHAGTNPIVLIVWDSLLDSLITI